ncbi:MAG: hypothetical protein K1X53_09620 [Candidatus Sumerlaeaceae bacterium]|nr:hypothetical protein [Candidatus Sumerlaeaceae bacterium]
MNKPTTAIFPTLRGRFLSVVFACIAAVIVSGCGEKEKYSIAKIDFPKLGDAEVEIGATKRLRDQSQQVATFAKGSPSLALAYVEWLGKNGWKQASGTQDVNAMNYVFIKDRTQVTIMFAAGRGVQLLVSRPAAEVDGQK